VIKVSFCSLRLKANTDNANLFVIVFVVVVSEVYSPLIGTNTTTVVSSSFSNKKTVYQEQTITTSNADVVESDLFCNCIDQILISL
jgi:hypothetical protein